MTAASVVCRAIDVLVDELGLRPPGVTHTPEPRLALQSWTTDGDSGALGAVVTIAGAPAPVTRAEVLLQRLLIGRALRPLMPRLHSELEELAAKVLRDRGLS